ncbi:MAG TPA: hypothetical protein VMT60_03885 [Candidatus Bathyarchaeia archaeon]|nr:hypothetical protein [Candidatus Bathyarchaeia archaeon]
MKQKKRTSGFTRRILRYAGFALGMVLGSWLIGAVGYRILERTGWVDAIPNAAMILGGMGPLNELRTTAGKLFTSVYALFAGIVFPMAPAVLAYADGQIRAALRARRQTDVHSSP